MQTTKNHTSEATTATHNPEASHKFSIKLEDLLNAIKTIEPTSSKDKSRFNICGVNFRKCIYFENNAEPYAALNIEATNGRVMSQITIKVEDSNYIQSDPVMSFFIPNENLKSFLGLLKKEKKNLKVLKFTVSKEGDYKQRVEIEGLTTLILEKSLYPKLDELKANILKDIPKDGYKAVSLNDIEKGLEDDHRDLESFLSKSLEAIEQSETFKTEIRNKGDVVRSDLLTKVTKALKAAIKSESERNHNRFLFNTLSSDFPDFVPARKEYTLNGFEHWNGRHGLNVSIRSTVLNADIRSSYAVFNQDYLQLLMDIKKNLRAFGLEACDCKMSSQSPLVFYSESSVAKFTFLLMPLVQY